MSFHSARKACPARAIAGSLKVGNPDLPGEVDSVAVQAGAANAADARRTVRLP